MDYSAANTALWNIIIQFGLIAGAILFCNMLRNRVRVIRSAMMPVSVMAGFLLLLLKYTGLVRIDGTIMEILVYHGIALGFIAMSLRVTNRAADSADRAALKSGAVIVSTYMVQGVVGLVISIALSMTVMPGFSRPPACCCPWATARGPDRPTTSAPAIRTWALRAGAASDLPSPRRDICAPASWA